MSVTLILQLTPYQLIGALYYKDQIRGLVYKLELPPQIKAIHNVLHFTVTSSITIMIIFDNVCAFSKNKNKRLKCENIKGDVRNSRQYTGQDARSRDSYESRRLRGRMIMILQSSRAHRPSHRSVREAMNGHSLLRNTPRGEIFMTAAMNPARR